MIVAAVIAGVVMIAVVALTAAATVKVVAVVVARPVAEEAVAYAVASTLTRAVTPKPRILTLAQRPAKLPIRTTRSKVLATFSATIRPRWGLIET